MTTSTPDQPKGEEIPLEDIDKILEAEDPEFAKEIAEVRSVEANKDVILEATVVGEADALPTEAEIEEKPLAGLAKYKNKIKQGLGGLKLRAKNRLATAGHDLVIFAKTRPKEFAIYSLVMAKIMARNALFPLRAFQQANGLQKLTFFFLLGIVGLSAWVLMHNFKGVWLPHIHEPILRTFEADADFVETFDPKEEGESFYSAFPQERFEYLFPRTKVNLKRTRENPNPMGAFEIIVLLDSKDTAVEVHDREVEFFDHLQRVFEEETFTDLESELGKGRLKVRIKRELNQMLTQGWVKDVNFKTFVLKP